MNINLRNQALSNFQEAGNLQNAIHALNFRKDNDRQLAALLPIIIPKIDAQVDSLIELAITQWQQSKS